MSCERPVEHVDQPDGAVLADQRVVGHLDHRQSAALRGDGVELAGGGLLPRRSSSSAVAPGLLVDDRGLRLIGVWVIGVSFVVRLSYRRAGARYSSARLRT